MTTCSLRPYEADDAGALWEAARESVPEVFRRDDAQTHVVRGHTPHREGWIANMLSVSSIAHQPAEDRTALAERLRELVPPGEVRRRYRTVAYWTRLA